MDRLPNDLLARIFSHLPTLDLGRMMSVSRSWNTLLSTSPKLWVQVKLSERPRQRSISNILQIVEVFSNRSQSTLEAIIIPSPPFKDLDISKMIQLLESSRATLTKLTLWPERGSSAMTDLMDLVSECSELEELDLTGDYGGYEQVETSPGNLTHFSCFNSDVITEKSIPLFSNLKVLRVMDSAGPLLLKVLSSCSNSLQYFTFEANLMQNMQDEFQETVSKSLHQLKVLRIEGSSETWSKEWDLSALNNLEELGINPEYLSLAPFRAPIKLHLSISTFEAHGEDDRLELLQRIIEVLDSCQTNIQVLALFNSWESHLIVL